MQCSYVLQIFNIRLNEYFYSSLSNVNSLNFDCKSFFFPLWDTFFAYKSIFLSGCYGATANYFFFLKTQIADIMQTLFYRITLSRERCLVIHVLLSTMNVGPFSRGSHFFIYAMNIILNS
jgi:hypothetical protein